MSDIKSILSGIAEGAPVTTPKKLGYRPKSSSEHHRSTRYTTFSHRPTDLKYARQSKPEIKPSTTYKKLFDSELRITNDTQLAKGKATIKLQQNRRKLKMQRYLKDNPQSKPVLEARAPLLHEDIFADRKSHQYRTLDRKSNKPTARPLQPEPAATLKEQITGSLKEKFDCALTPVGRNSHRVRWNSPERMSTDSRRYANATPGNTSRKGSCNISVEGSSRDSQPISRLTSKKKSRSQHKTQPAIQQQPCDDEQLDLVDDLTKQERLNRIMDMIGDTKLNNILWNDPAVTDILEQLQVYDEKQLDDYLEHNTQYFETLFRSSPFGSFKLHYIQPKHTSYQRDNLRNSFSGSPLAKSFNDLPYLTDQDYQSLAKLYRQQGRIRGKKTIQQTQFVPKKSSTQMVIPPDSYDLDQPQIASATTYKMNFPDRGDYDPRRIFKRPLEQNVVTGAEWVYRTTYGQSFGRSAVNISPGPDPFCIDYIKERNTPKKSFHTLNTPELTTSYQRDHSGDKTALYNRPLPFKYASELEKPQPQPSLPADAYTTGKELLARTIVEQQDELQKRRRKHIQPWKFRLLSKLKALLEYKRFLSSKLR